MMGNPKKVSEPSPGSFIYLHVTLKVENIKGAANFSVLTSVHSATESPNCGY